jgi:predicted signal transduction protein with EAL and GGDEF domain
MNSTVTALWTSWSASDVTPAQIIVGLACVICAVCIGATLHWYFDRCDRLEIESLEKALRKMRRRGR